MGVWYAVRDFVPFPYSVPFFPACGKMVMCGNLPHIGIFGRKKRLSPYPSNVVNCYHVRRILEKPLLYRAAFVFVFCSCYYGTTPIITWDKLRPQASIFTFAIEQCRKLVHVFPFLVLVCPIASNFIPCWKYWKFRGGKKRKKGV